MFNKINKILFLTYIIEFQKINNKFIKFAYLILCFCFHMTLFYLIFTEIFQFNSVFKSLNIQSLIMFIVFILYITISYLRNEYLTQSTTINI